MGSEWDLLGAPGDRAAHWLGDFVRPGGAVGLLLVCVVVGVVVAVGVLVVGLPGGVVGEPVVCVVGATVGRMVGVADGVALDGCGVLVGSAVPVEVGPDDGSSV